jgi:hypothetical protein
MLETAFSYLETIPWSSAASILFGASISALVSFILQRSSFKEARLQKEKDRREVRKALALSLVFKMIRISTVKRTSRARALPSSVGHPKLAAGLPGHERHIEQQPTKEAKA